MGLIFAQQGLGVGQHIGTSLLGVATDLSLAAFGIMALVTVIAGIMIFLNIGGQGVQKVLRSYIMAMFLGAIFVGAFNRLATGVLNTFKIS